MSALCACCGRAGRHYARGWIKSCYQRWHSAGKPEEGPPPLGTACCWRSTQGRIEDYAWLTREQGLSLYQAAARVGVSSRTAERYERALRTQADPGEPSHT